MTRYFMTSFLREFNYKDTDSQQSIYLQRWGGGLGERIRRECGLKK